MYDVFFLIFFEIVFGLWYNVVVIIVGKFRYLFWGIVGKRLLVFKDLEIIFYELGCFLNGIIVVEG